MDCRKKSLHLILDGLPAHIIRLYGWRSKIEVAFMTALRVLGD